MGTVATLTSVYKSAEKEEKTSRPPRLTPAACCVDVACDLVTTEMSSPTQEPPCWDRWPPSDEEAGARGGGNRAHGGFLSAPGRFGVTTAGVANPYDRSTCQ